VNNATYLSILEEARWEFITQNGWGFERIHQVQQGPIVLDVHLTFRKEIRLRERVRIESKVLDYPSKVGRLEQRILNSKNEECAYAVFKFAFFDLRQRKLLAPPDDWLKAIGAVI
jgi:acyl-CoA thioester hydrolase